MSKQIKQVKKEAVAAQEAVTVVVKTQGVDITVITGEVKPKRALTEEQKSKMAAGRKAAAERRKVTTESEDEEDDPSSASTESPPPKQGKQKARRSLEEVVGSLEMEIQALQARLADAHKQLEEMSDSSDDELPRFKADGTLDRRYKVSKLIARSDGGLDLRFKASKKAVEKGLVKADGKLVKEE